MADEAQRIEQTLSRIERRQTALLQAVHLLIINAAGAADMTKMHDELLASARALGAAVDGLGSKADALIASKSQGDTALSDVQAALADANSKLTALDSKLSAAVAVPDNDGTNNGGATLERRAD